VVKIYIDIQQTAPSVFTQTKTTLRGLYEAAKERNKPTEDEKGDWDVLLHNEEGKVMETTIFNIAFYRSSRWLTPCTSTGCLGGVMRQWLLRAGRITPDNDDRGESVLRRENIVNGEWVLLFNGVQGCRLGRIYDKSTSIPSSISPRI
jgi:branched-subunit amino acid aminotransferase/4-amino-4-deoxychorismate lyase